MSETIKTYDRRKNRRFKVPPDAFMVIKQPKFKMGQIVDMSVGGLSFCYTEGSIPPIDNLKVDILLADDGYYLDQIPVNVVSDFVIGVNYPFNEKPVKRCSVKFNGLSDAKLEQISTLIPKHTSGYILDRRSSGLHQNYS